MIVELSSKSVKPSQEPQVAVGRWNGWIRYATYISLGAISLVHELDISRSDLFRVMDFDGLLISLSSSFSILSLPFGS